MATYKAALTQTESGPTGTRQNTQPGLVEVSGCEPHSASAHGMVGQPGAALCSAQHVRQAQLHARAAPAEAPADLRGAPPLAQTTV